MPVTSPRSTARGLPGVPLDWGGATEAEFQTPQEVFSHLKDWTRLIAQAVRNLLDGKILATGSVTLTASAATTTLSDRRIGPDSVILLMPTTANAAAALATTYVASRGDQTATINHASNAQTDKTFAYAVLG